MVSPTTGTGMRRTPLAVIFASVALDAVGVGLVFPILPRLIEDVTHSENVAPYIGIMTALYAVMQFLFAPVLGALSDRIGRRPVLLLSLAGAAINYVAMAFAPHLWMLFLGRAFAGATGANVSVAMAYLTDVSSEHERARLFGIFGAMFGIGFIAGPVLGGLLGDHWVRLPFIVAAALTGCNLALASVVLTESRVQTPGRNMDWTGLDPFRPMRWVLSRRGLVPFTLVFFILSAAGEVYGTCWALWGFDAFGWNGRWIGLSLGAFGFCQVLTQALLPGPMIRWLGERGAVLAGLAGNCLALVAMAFARRTWVVFAVMPMFALGGVGAPALQSRATRLVSAARQGELQGVFASAVSLASIVAPLVFSTLYVVVHRAWPGAIWLSVVATYAIAVPLILRATKTRESSPRAGAASFGDPNVSIDSSRP
jgi:DHA1 family tetracycline resistance protein-like MFS transporter